MSDTKKPRWRWQVPAGDPVATRDSGNRALSPEVLDLLRPTGPLAARFALGSVLGVGGHAVVVHAKERSTGREFALKILHRRPGATQRKRLLREGRLAASLDHPGIVKVYSVEEIDGFPYLVYELVPEARPLDEACEQLDRDAQLGLLQDLGLALGHAHARGVVHRDVKPTNVLVDASGRVRVVDFGLGRTLAAERLTQTGALLGTPLFMAPEQFRGRTAGPAADVWALGVMLYTTLTGSHPFPATSLMELASQVNTRSPAPPRSLDRTVSPALNDVCTRALSLQGVDRYPNGAAFAEALAEARQGRSSLRRRWRPEFAVGLGLLLACGVYASLVPERPPGLDTALTRFAAGAMSPGELEAALTRGAPAPLRAQAHLALARCERVPLAQRIAHAERCGQLDSRLGTPAARARAWALVAHGQLPAAEAALREAWASTPASDRLRDARRLLESGGASQVVSLLEADPSREGRVLRGEAAAACGQAELALKLATELHAEFLDGSSAALEIRARAAGAGAPWEAVERLRGSFPRSSEVRAALVELRLARGELAVARALAVPGSALERSLVALSETDTAWRDALTPGQRGTQLGQAARRWWLNEARRERVLLERELDPAWWVTPRGAELRSSGLRRAREWLARARELTPEAERRPLQLEQLLLRAAWPGEEPVAPASEALALVSASDHGAGVLLLGRALIEANRLDEARALLEHDPARDPFEDPRALWLLVEALADSDSHRAAQLEERAKLLEGSRRDEAAAVLNAFLNSRGRRKPPREEHAAAYAAVLRLDPLHWPALLRRSTIRFRSSLDPEDLEQAIAAAERYPEGPQFLLEGLLSLSSGGGLRGPTSVLSDFGKRVPVGRFVRSLFLGRAAELEGYPASLVLPELDSWIAAEPTSVLARVLRASAWIQLGELEAAEVDLDRAAQAMPRSASVAFAYARLSAARGRPSPEVAEALQRADSLRFKEWTRPAWRLRPYPELERYADEPECGVLRR